MYDRHEAAFPLADDELFHDLSPFLSALFQPDDIVLVRHVETWTKPDGKKASKETGTSHITPGGLLRGDLWRHHLRRAAASRSNVFFGINPRWQPGEQWDLGCQVRVVRHLSADTDGLTPDEARDRCRQDGLPDPSVGVCSGNWSQLYWILDEPFVIDDCGDPFPIWKRWEWPADARKARKVHYRVDQANGQEVVVEPHALLSEKAWQAQEAVAGIAQAIGGDHTYDLARVLRLPGTWNRKDERNGTEPRPCFVAWCDPERRHRFEDFPRNKDIRHKKPGARKAYLAGPEDDGRDAQGKPFDGLTPAQVARFDQLLARSRDAAVGGRSDADHALLCHCVRVGLGREDAWGRVQDAGKFGERGWAYFDAGWRNAARDVAREDDPIRDILEMPTPYARDKAARLDLGDAKDVTPADALCLNQAVQAQEAILPVALAPAPAAERRRRGYRLTDLMCLPPPEWLVQEHFHRGGFAALYGPPGSYKSFLALDVALCVATGRPFLGTFEARKGKAVYVCSEGRQGLRARVRAWLRHHGAEAPADIVVIPEVFDMTDGDEAVALAEVIGEDLGDHDVDLLVIDTLARNFGSGDENAAKDMNKFVNVLAGLGRHLGAAVLVVHHTGKDEAKERGHSALRGAADTMIRMARSGKADAVVAVDKQKDAEELEPYLLSPRKVDLDDGQGSIVLAAHDQMRTRFHLMKSELKDFLVELSVKFEGRPFSQAQAREGGHARSTVSRRCGELAGKGLLVRSGDDYVIPPAALGLATTRRGF